MTISVHRLSQCRSLAELTEPAAEAVAEHAREVAFRARERLIPLGQPPERLLILTEGLAKLVGVSVTGHERILNIYRPDDMVGPSVLMESPKNDLEVAAMSHVRALSVSRRDLLIVCRAHPSLILSLAREVSRQLMAMTDRVLTATSAEVPIRLSQLLLEFADATEGGRESLVPLAHPLTQESMSQIIGASRPHTSTVLRNLEACGAVQRRSGRGLLVRPARLQHIVEYGDLDPVPAETLRLSA